MKGVWNPKILATNIGDALVGIPIVFLGQCLVDTIIKVFIMREDNMTTNIVELGAHLLALEKSKGTGSGSCKEKLLTNPSGVMSVEARPPGVSFESTIIHEDPFCI